MKICTTKIEKTVKKKLTYKIYVENRTDENRPRKAEKRI